MNEASLTLETILEEISDDYTPDEDLFDLLLLSEKW